jgi:Ca2+-binding EF-hand superfamily protein
MGKKFITLMSHNKKYRLYSEDIQNVFQKTIRKIPHLPKYLEAFKAYDDDTEESCQSNEELQQSLKHI